MYEAQIQQELIPPEEQRDINNAAVLIAGLRGEQVPMQITPENCNRDHVNCVARAVCGLANLIERKEAMDEIWQLDPNFKQKDKETREAIIASTIEKQRAQAQLKSLAEQVPYLEAVNQQQPDKKPTTESVIEELPIEHPQKPKEEQIQSKILQKDRPVAIKSDVSFTTTSVFQEIKPKNDTITVVLNPAPVERSVPVMSQFKADERTAIKYVDQPHVDIKIAAVVEPTAETQPKQTEKHPVRVNNEVVAKKIPPLEVPSEVKPQILSEKPKKIEISASKKNNIVSPSSPQQNSTVESAPVKKKNTDVSDAKEIPSVHIKPIVETQTEEKKKTIPELQPDQILVPKQIIAPEIAKKIDKKVEVQPASALENKREKTEFIETPISTDSEENNEDINTSEPKSLQEEDAPYIPESFITTANADLTIETKRSVSEQQISETESLIEPPPDIFAPVEEQLSENVHTETTSEYVIEAHDTIPSVEQKINLFSYEETEEIVEEQATEIPFEKLDEPNMLNENTIDIPIDTEIQTSSPINVIEDTIEPTEEMKTTQIVEPIHITVDEINKDTPESIEAIEHLTEDNNIEFSSDMEQPILELDTTESISENSDVPTIITVSSSKETTIFQHSSQEKKVIKHETVTKKENSTEEELLLNIVKNLTILLDHLKDISLHLNENFYLKDFGQKSPEEFKNDPAFKSYDIPLILWYILQCYQFIYRV